EIPAGKLEVGEAGSEAAAALRELEEETGYTGQLDYLYAFYIRQAFRVRQYNALIQTRIEDSPRLFQSA
ncbi:MAG: NUDIX domain-containing protein, partial [Victivallales bacterium]|nr:NUDIX domain-containing protein [Victivallales bacterium]